MTKDGRRTEEATKFTGRSRVGRFFTLLRSRGPSKTLGVVASVLEDDYLRSFDRRYGVRTSGFIALKETSLGRHSQITNMHRYRGVNAWAFRNMLSVAQLRQDQKFVDIGSGLGRACLLAAEYGFVRVSGVELVPEFCDIAQNNVKNYLNTHKVANDIRILNMDARVYTADSEDEVYFLFRPFSGELLANVCENIRARAAAFRRPVTVIYSERMAQNYSNYPAFSKQFGMKEIWEYSGWGQNFWGFEVNC